MVQDVDFAEFDPLDYDNLTQSCVRELMRQPIQPLPLKIRFRGAGVYALFYTGDFAPYGDLISRDATDPIYVGSAVPEGTRKGTPAPALHTTARKLYDRIRQHTRSIQYASTTLRVEDFLCRFLVVRPLWITMVERFLINHYQPIWNVCIEGFGIHDPGSGRSAGEISWWDALHPGRPPAARLRQTRTSAEVEERLRRCLQERGRFSASGGL
jgi:hypothetical protein